MIRFFRNIISGTIGTLVALALVVGLLYMWFLSIIADITEEKPYILQDKTILVLDMDASITDIASERSLKEATQEALSGPRLNIYYLLELIQAIQMAADDPSIGGIFIKGSLISLGTDNGFPVLKEVRENLEFFKSKKPVYAYLVTPSIKDYYLASAASAVVMNPFGMLEFAGLEEQQIYFGDLFKRYGVGVQTSRVGKYKSAVEIFTGSQMSKEDRDQSQLLMDQVWNSVLTDIARDRKQTVGQLQEVANTLAILEADEAKVHGLVDEVAYFDQVLGYLTKTTGEDPHLGSFRQVNMHTYIREKVDAHWLKKHSRNQVAIVYAEGEITMGESVQHSVGSTTLTKHLRAIRMDDAIKAVVLRINSPGGGAIAAEEIQREVALLSAVKPLVVSFGTYAASGGYWIGLPALKIFAEPTTITGSIGTFLLMFDVKDLANKYGIFFDGVKTAAMADVGSFTRPKTPQELERLQMSADFIYDQFVKKVAFYRKLDVAQVQEIAQGRVWSGEAALQHGLVDEIGGLSAAINEAVAKAGLGDDWNFYEFPEKRGFFELIAEYLGSEFANPVVGINQFDVLIDRIQNEIKCLRMYNDPINVYARLPYMLYID